jgi:hypothetical protein
VTLVRPFYKEVQEHLLQRKVLMVVGGKRFDNKLLKKKKKA